MSNGLAKDYYTSVIEFISNSHDAGANNISISASLDQLVIEDDGVGMDKESIHNFFTKGTDYKRINTETPEGRRMLGRFGLATLLLRHLGDAYRVETWRNGQKIVVEQDFARDGWKRPKTDVFRSSEEKPSGTRITITKPRYKFNSGQFSIEKLRTEITWGFPPLRDLKIRLNGEEVQKRGTVVRGTEYDATAKISDKVRISGSIFSNSHRGSNRARLPHSGIILYVNGRRVGDPSEFGLTRIDPRFQGNVLGLIDVYGLPDGIRFDRSGFLRTQAYLKIKDCLLAILQSMKDDLNAGVGRMEYYSARTKVGYIDNALALATDRLNTKLQCGGKNKYTLAFDAGEHSGPIARLDEDTNTIYINQSNPKLIRRTGKITGQDLETALLMSAIVAVAEHEVGNKSNAAFFSNLDNQITLAADRLFESYQTVHADLRTTRVTGDITPVSSVYLNPYRLYLPIELSQLTGWDAGTLRVLMLSCLTSDEMHGAIVNTRKIKGTKVRVLLPELEGFVPAGKLARPDYWASDWRYNYDFQVDRILQREAQNVDYLKNVATVNPVENPFILVKKGYERQFLKLWEKLG